MVSEETMIERAVAWCRSGERSDAEYLDREFAHTLVRNPLLFVAFRSGQRDRQAEIEDLKLDLRAAGDECGTLREHNATLRQAVAELKDRNRRQDEDLIDLRAAIAAQAAEIERLREASLEFRDTVLHERGPLAEAGMDGDQINAVLGAFDDAFPVSALSANDRGEEKAVCQHKEDS